jgi:hypothetical protein
VLDARIINFARHIGVGMALAACSLALPSATPPVPTRKLSANNGFSP